jgi:hypothetical protein
MLKKGLYFFYLSSIKYPSFNVWTFGWWFNTDYIPSVPSAKLREKWVDWVDYVPAPRVEQ